MKPKMFNFDDEPAYDSQELIDIISKLSLDERAEKFFSFVSFTRQLQIAGIQLRNPGMNQEQVESLFKQQQYEFYLKQNTHE